MVNLEGVYDDDFDHDTPGIASEMVRRGAYLSFLNGACGFTSSSYGLWMWGQGPAFGKWRGHPPSVTSAMDRPYATYLQHLAKLLSSIEWWRLEPGPDLILNQPSNWAGRMVLAKTSYHECAVAYLPNNPEIVLNLKPFPRGLIGHWFNPRTGELTEIHGPVASQSSRTFRRPGPGDWVLFCIDDHYFGWPCAPNRTFDKYTGYEPGERCSRRDLIAELAPELAARGVKLICYYAGLNGCMQDPKSWAGLMDDGNDMTPPSTESRRRRIEVLREFTNRYKDTVAGWWFDAVMPDSYRAQPHDWWAIESVVHLANPQSVIAFSWGRNRQACMCKGVDDFTSGDSYKKQDLTRLTPMNMPASAGLLWHGKIYCGNVYHGQGDANQFSDQELIDWIKACNRQGGVCTLDWPFDPETGLIKPFGMAQMKRIAQAVRRGD